MTSMFTVEKILTNISYYLTPKELLLFSSINKCLYFTKLNPIYNPIINSLYRFHVLKEIYFSEFDEDLDINKEKKILDDYNITQNNWKAIYLEIMQHYSKYNHDNNKKIYINAIYETFKDHLYLPFVRKENIILEPKESTLHQLFFYDFYKNNAIVANHFDKYLDLKNNDFIGKDSDDFIIRKKLLFENELMKFNETVKNVQGNNQYIIILEKIINYDYKAIDDLYCKDNKIAVNSTALEFILCLNHTAILFSKLLYSKINIYFYDSENSYGNELIKQYIKTHDNFVNFSLSINEKFNNINIIINYLYRFITDKNKGYYEFSLYKMLFKIMKNEIYDKIETYLLKEFKILNDQYCQELLESIDNERKQSCDSGTKPDSNDSFEENDDFEMVECDLSSNEEKVEITKKDLINMFMKCVTDFSINEKNALAINHSKIKMDENYIKYENILKDSFVEGINNCIIKEKKPVENIFLTVKNLLSINDEYYKRVNLGNYKGFNFIRRTKKIIFTEVQKCLEKNLHQNIKEDFSEYIKNNTNDNNKEKNVINKKINININQNMEEMIDGLDKEEKVELDKIQEENLTKVKNELTTIINSNKNASNIVNNEAIINAYLENVSLNYIDVLKEILSYFYVEKILYSEFDKKIKYLLNSSLNNSYNRMI